MKYNYEFRSAIDDGVEVICEIKISAETEQSEAELEKQRAMLERDFSKKFGQPVEMQLISKEA